MKGPRRARMPVYGVGSKYLGRTEKETEWHRFHAPQSPAISIAPLHSGALEKEHDRDAENPAIPIAALQVAGAGPESRSRPLVQLRDLGDRRRAEPLAFSGGAAVSRLRHRAWPPRGSVPWEEARLGRGLRTRPNRAPSEDFVRPLAARSARCGPGAPRFEPSTRGSFRKRADFSNLNHPPDGVPVWGPDSEGAALVCTPQPPAIPIAPLHPMKSGSRFPGCFLSLSFLSWHWVRC